MPITKEELAGAFKEATEGLVKSVEEKNAALKASIKEEVTKELGELRKEVAEKAIHVDKVHIEVNEPEPSFIAKSGEYFQMVAKAATDSEAKQKLCKALEVHWKAPSGLNTLVASEGGFLPTAQIMAEIKEATYETGNLVKECDVMPLGGTNDRLVWNEALNEDRSTVGSFGGIVAYRVNEGVAGTTSQPSFAERELAVADMMARVPATRQLLADSVSLGVMINRNAPKAFNKKLDNEIVRGTGAGQGLGVIGHAATISIAKETNQTADTIVKENIEKMYDSLDPDLLTGAKWYINPHARKELRNLSMAVGTGGAPVYLPEGNVAGSPFGTLLGLPVVPLGTCSKLGDVGDLILGNFNEYLIVEKSGIEAAESMHILFNTNEMMYRFTWRVNGMPKRRTTITPENYNSGEALAAFITLAERA